MSSTGNTPDYTRHTYKVTHELKSYTVYELSNFEGKVNLLTDILRTEQFQAKSQTTRVDDYLRLRTDPKSWTRSQLITGLRPTSNQGLFSGDSIHLSKANTAKTLLIFLFSKDKQTLFIDVYREVCSNNKVALQNIINTY
jgi:hypothetical protein